MKPREFDDLIRQKFDENDFEYNPQNWGRLKEQLEGRTKKRSIIAWWWMPAMGVAASVALAIGVNFMWRQAESGNAGLGNFALNLNYEPKQIPAEQQGTTISITDAVNPVSKTIHHKNKTTHSPAVAQTEEKFAINLHNALSYNNTKTDKKINLLANTPGDHSKKVTKKPLAANQGMETFSSNEPKKTPTLSVILMGGVNHGGQNSGYVAGATIRQMVNSKVYVESDVAFVSNNHNEDITENWVNTQTTRIYSKVDPSAKTTQITSAPQYRTTYTPESKVINQNYTMSYAQVSPSLGVQVMKKMSVAAGPDFQQALADNRPASITDVTYNNVAVMPLFDFGFIGKTEYSVTKNVKAQVSYRKGMNSLFSAADKYLERDYLQVQLRCAIFNK